MKMKLLALVGALGMLTAACQIPGQSHDAQTHVNATGGSDCFVEHNHFDVAVGDPFPARQWSIGEFIVDQSCDAVRVVFTYGEEYDAATNPNPFTEIVELVRNNGVWTEVQGAIGTDWSTSVVSFPGTGDADRLVVESPDNFVSWNTEVRTFENGVALPSGTTFDSFH